MGNKSQCRCYKGYSVQRSSLSTLKPATFTTSHLDKIEQTSETPRHRIEPFRPRVGPLGVNQLSQVTVSEVVTGTTTCGVVLLGDVAGGVVANAKEITCPFDVALLLGRKCGQARVPEALLDTLPSCKVPNKMLSCFPNIYMHTHI